MGRKKVEEEKAEIKNDPHSQIPTIRDAVTYIMDEQGNEIKQSTENVSRESASRA